MTALDWVQHSHNSILGFEIQYDKSLKKMEHLLKSSFTQDHWS
jgi:hypothetical protein